MQRQHQTSQNSYWCASILCVLVLGCLLSFGTIAHGCELNCLQGGQPNSICTECEGCGGAWVGRKDKGTTFHASLTTTPNNTIAVTEYECDVKKIHYYKPAVLIGVPQLVPGQSLGVQQRLVDTTSHQYFVQLESSGDVVLYSQFTSSYSRVWHSNTANIVHSAIDYALVLGPVEGKLVVIATLSGGGKQTIPISNVSGVGQCARATATGHLQVYSDKNCTAVIWSSSNPAPAMNECVRSSTSALFYTPASIEMTNANLTAIYEHFDAITNDSSFSSTPDVTTQSPSFFAHNDSIKYPAFYSSQLCVDGYCDTALSTNLTWDKTCTHWDDSASISTLIAKQQTAMNASIDALKQSDTNKVCNYNMQCAGFGVDSFTGRMSNGPTVLGNVLKLSYTNPSRVWNGRLYPDTFSFEEYNPNPLPDCEVYGSRPFGWISDFVSDVQSRVSKGSGRTGGNVYGVDWDTVFTNSFKSGNSNNVRGADVLFYGISLPSSAKFSDLDLDEFFQVLMFMLPPDQSTPNRALLWQRFFTMYGTAFATSTQVGGSIYQQSNIAPTVWDEFTANLAAYAKIDFANSTGLCAATGSVPAGYARELSLGCVGGDNSLCEKTSMPAWIESVASAPRVITLEWQPLDRLLVGPLLYLNQRMYSAIAWQQRQQTAAWQAENLCPTCGPNSTCAHPAQNCACDTWYHPVSRTECAKNILKVAMEVWDSSPGCTGNPTYSYAAALKPGNCFSSQNGAQCCLTATSEIVANWVGLPPSLPVPSGVTSCMEKQVGPSLESLNCRSVTFALSSLL